MSEDQAALSCLHPLATVIEVDIDYETHFTRAWDESQALWEADELDRWNRAAATTCNEAPRLPVDCKDDIISPSPAHSRILSKDASDVSLSVTNDPLPRDAHLPPLPDQGTSDQLPGIPDESPTTNLPASPSERPSTPRSTTSYLDGSELSDCDSIPHEGSRKRRRREDWSPEKIAREREKKRAKKAQRRQEGTFRPRKKSESQKEKKRAKRAAKMLERGGDDSNYDGPTPSGYRLPKNALRTWGIPIEIPAEYEMETASTAEGAYVGINRPVDRKWGTDDYTLEGEKRKGRTVVHWDGVYVVFFLRSPFFRLPLLPSPFSFRLDSLLGYPPARPTPSSTRRGGCWSSSPGGRTIPAG